MPSEDAQMADDPTDNPIARLFDFVATIAARVAAQEMALVVVIMSSFSPEDRKSFNENLSRMVKVMEKTPYPEGVPKRTAELTRKESLALVGRLTKMLELLDNQAASGQQEETR